MLCGGYSWCLRCSTHFAPAVRALTSNFYLVLPACDTSVLM
eukprot:COSAG02_NODE_36218_length_457_cov_1.290503_1_plen_40_part_01